MCVSLLSLDRGAWETEFAIQSPSASSFPEVLLRTATSASCHQGSDILRSLTDL